MTEVHFGTRREKLSHVPCGGAKRPRDPARTLEAATLPRVARGPGRRTRARPRCGAAEEAVGFQIQIIMKQARKHAWDFSPLPHH